MHKFEPKEDITAFELSQLIGFMFAPKRVHQETVKKVAEQLEAMPPEIKRHLRKVDEPVVESVGFLKSIRGWFGLAKKDGG